MNGFRHFRLERETDGFATLLFDKAGESTNTLSKDVFEELARALDELERLPPRALLIRSGKATGFIAGADVGEFTRLVNPEEATALVRRGWDAFDRLASAPYPTLALIRGFCLGGGLELALACRYRVAVDEPGTRLGLPEVLLGIVPGWGGMRRLPRLAGAPAALDLMLTGRTIDARQAKRLGVVDEAVPPRIMDNAARGVLKAAPPPRRLRFPLSMSLQPIARGFVAGQARKQVEKRARREHYPAPYAILDIWEKADGDPFALPPSHPSSLTRLIEHPTTGNLIRVFGLHERLKSLGKAGDFEARHVHVVGAGTMGGDIAAWCALRGCRVSLQDQGADRLGPAFQRAAQLFRRKLRDPLRVRDALDRLVPDVAGDGVSRADVVIEAIFEDLAAKQQLFAEVERCARPSAILATNTSSIPLEQIASAMADPSRLIGLHFFNPAARMLLVEIVSGRDTRRDLVAPAAAFCRQLDKLPLPVTSAPGFLVNRILAPYLMEAMRAVDDGIAPETVDAAAVAFGMPMGPIELADTVGLDICLAVGRLLSGERAANVPTQLQRLIDAGHRGKKSGRGFYEFKDGQPVKRPAASVPPRLAERLIEPMLVEARSALAEGIVADADLVDAGAIFGTGFPPFRGGPMHYLRTLDVRPNAPLAPVAQVG